MMNNRWLEILNKVKSGELSVSEGAVRLESDSPVQLAAPAPGPAADVHAVPGLGNTADESIQPDLGWWKDAWLVPLWAGLLIFVMGALLMGWAYRGVHNFWLFCAWLPMLAGLLLLILGLWSRQARWVHVRVNETTGSRVAISVPIPTRLVSWLLRVFGPRVEALRDKDLIHLASILDALAQTTEPLVVEVDEENGSRVRVYIL